MKKTLITGMTMLALSIPTLANDGVVTKQVEKVTEEFSLKAETPKFITGKQDAIKKIASKFNYYQDAMYEIFVSDLYLTRIELAPDEILVASRMGDTSQWALATSKGGETNATSIYIKAKEIEENKTNLIIQTNKRTYNFIIEASEDKFNPLVKFIYPSDENLANNLTETLTNSTNVILDGTNIDDIVTSYDITPNNLDFSPKSVINDGKKTYIKFSENMTQSPILIVKGSNGKLQEVNYHQENGVIRVDEVIKEGQLKLDKRTVKFKLR